MTALLEVAALLVPDCGCEDVVAFEVVADEEADDVFTELVVVVAVV